MREMAGRQAAVIIDDDDEDSIVVAGDTNGKIAALSSYAAPTASAAATMNVRGLGASGAGTSAHPISVGDSSDDEQRDGSTKKLGAARAAAMSAASATSGPGKEVRATLGGSGRRLATLGGISQAGRMSTSTSAGRVGSAQESPSARNIQEIKVQALAFKAGKVVAPKGSVPPKLGLGGRSKLRKPSKDADSDDDDAALIRENAAASRWETARPGLRAGTRAATRPAAAPVARPKRAAATASRANLRRKAKDSDDEDEDEDEAGEDEEEEEEDEADFIDDDDEDGAYGRAGKKRGRPPAKGRSNTRSGRGKTKYIDLEDDAIEKLLKDDDGMDDNEDFDDYNSDDMSDDGEGGGVRVKRRVMTRSKLKNGGAITIEDDDEEDEVQIEESRGGAAGRGAAPATISEADLARAEELAKGSLALKHLAPADKLAFAALWKKAHQIRDALASQADTSSAAAASAEAADAGDGASGSGAGASTADGSTPRDSAGTVNPGRSTGDASKRGGLVTTERLQTVLGWGILGAGALTKAGGVGTLLTAEGAAAAAAEAAAGGSGSSEASAVGSGATSALPPISAGSSGSSSSSSAAAEAGAAATSSPSSNSSVLNLTPYQLVGVNWMLLLHRAGLNGVLADEMGLGKSVQTIGLLAWLKAGGEGPAETAGGGPHLIVTPGSTVGNWARELRKWAPSLRVGIYMPRGDINIRMSMQSSLRTGVGLDEVNNAAISTNPEPSPRSSPQSSPQASEEPTYVDSGDDGSVSDEGGGSGRPGRGGAGGKQGKRGRRDSDDDSESQSDFSQDADDDEEEDIGSEDERAVKPAADTARAFDVLITTYTLFDKQGANASVDRTFLRKYAWKYVICDEGHNLKNAKGNRFGVLNSLSTEHRLLLTGTPIQNTLPELFALLRFLQPTLFTRKVEGLFTSHAQESDEKKQKRILADLRKVVMPFILRRAKADVLSDLPPKTDKVLSLPLPPVHAAVYNRLLEEARAALGMQQDAKAAKGKKGQSGLAKSALDAAGAGASSSPVDGSPDYDASLAGLIADGMSYEDAAAMLAASGIVTSATTAGGRPSRAAAVKASQGMAAVKLIESQPMRTLGKDINAANAGAVSAPPALGKPPAKGKGKPGAVAAESAVPAADPGAAAQAKPRGLDAFLRPAAASSTSASASAIGRAVPIEIDLDSSALDSSVDSGTDGLGLGMGTGTAAGRGASACVPAPARAGPNVKRGRPAIVSPAKSEIEDDDDVYVDMRRAGATVAAHSASRAASYAIGAASSSSAAEAANATATTATELDRSVDFDASAADTSVLASPQAASGRGGAAAGSSGRDDADSMAVDTEAGASVGNVLDGVTPAKGPSSPSAASAGPTPASFGAVVPAGPRKQHVVLDLTDTPAQAAKHAGAATVDGTGAAATAAASTVAAPAAPPAVAAPTIAVVLAASVGLTSAMPHAKHGKKPGQKVMNGVFGELRRASQHPLLLRVWYSDEDTLLRVAGALCEAGAFGSDAATRPDKFTALAYKELQDKSDYAIWELAREAEHVEYDVSGLASVAAQAGSGGGASGEAGAAATSSAAESGAGASTAAPQQLVVKPISAPADYRGRRLLRFVVQALPVWSLASSAKMQWMCGFLPEALAQGHRVLIFSQLMDQLHIIEHVLTGLGIRYLRLDGSVSIPARQALIDTFNSDVSIGCFLVSTKAGGLGLNLTAADTVIIHDSDWNPHADAQAVDRAHRLGQTRPVTVYRLAAQGTLDDKIAAVARAKLNLDNALKGIDVDQTPSKPKAAKGKNDVDINKLLLDALA